MIALNKTIWLRGNLETFTPHRLACTPCWCFENYRGRCFIPAMGFRAEQVRITQISRNDILRTRHRCDINLAALVASGARKTYLIFLWYNENNNPGAKLREGIARTFRVSLFYRKHCTCSLSTTTRRCTVLL